MNFQQNENSARCHRRKRKRPLRETTNITGEEMYEGPPTKMSPYDSEDESPGVRLPTDSTEILDLLRWLLPTSGSRVPSSAVEELLDDLCWLLPDSFGDSEHWNNFNDVDYMRDALKDYNVADVKRNFDIQSEEIPDNNNTTTLTRRYSQGKEDKIITKCEKDFVDRNSGNNLFTTQEDNSSLILKQEPCSIPKYEQNSPKTPNDNEKKRLECHTCHKYFASKETLRTHKLRHSGKSLYNCDICPKSFSTPTGLKSHKMSHSEDRPFACTLCEKAFKTMAVLNKHRETHLPDKKYSCEVCQKGFKTLAGLDYHRLIHKGEKAYPCGSCRKSFRTPSSYNQHQRSYHGGSDLIIKQEV